MCPQAVVLSHNVYWFQGAPFEGYQPGPPDAAIVRALARLYASAQPDLVCLQEVQGEGAFLAIRDALEMEGAYLPGSELPQYGGAMLWSAAFSASIVDSSSANPAPQRFWQIATVRPTAADGPVPLRVANVHLPSDRQIGREAAAQRRRREIQQVLSAGPQPDLLLGDLNEGPEEGVAQLLQHYGYREAAEVLSLPRVPTTLDGERKDHVWGAQRWQQHLIRYNAWSADDLSASIAGKHHLSDHLPVCVTVAW